MTPSPSLCCIYVAVDDCLMLLWISLWRTEVGISSDSPKEVTLYTFSSALSLLFELRETLANISLEIESANINEWVHTHTDLLLIINNLHASAGSHLVCPCSVRHQTTQPLVKRTITTPPTPLSLTRLHSLTIAIKSTKTEWVKSSPLTDSEMCAVMKQVEQIPVVRFNLHQWTPASPAVTQPQWTDSFIALTLSSC